MKLNKLQNYMIFGYILFLVFGFVYVRKVITSTSIKTYEKDNDKKESVKPAKAYLIFQGKDTFNARLQNIDTVGDFLNKLRDNDQLFFERTRYTYGTEISDVNHVKTPEGFEWKVFSNGTDITYAVDDIKLVDESTYELKLVKQ